MNRIVCKSLSILMAVIMLFTAVPMLVSAEGEVTAPEFAVEKVSETTTNFTLKIALKSGSFQCFDATLTVDGATCTSILLADEFEAFVKELKKSGKDVDVADCGNAGTGKISLAITESCVAPMDIAVYNFTKSEKAGVVGSDIELSFESCYIDAEGEDVAADTSADISVPETHTHVCTDDAWQVEVAATCTAEGTEKATCSACDEVFTRSIAKLPHDATKIETVPATCTVAGSQKTLCSVCDELISEETIPATGHVNTREDKKEPTCTEAGYIKVYCKDCDVLVSEQALAATGHDTEEVKKDATCTEDGYIRVVCKNCGEIFSETVLTKKGHGETRSEIVLPTCTEGGYSRYYCVDCGELLHEIINEATGHLYVEEKKAADCHEDGYLKISCSVCHEVFSYVISPKTEHEWTSWAVIKQPTYRSDGLKRRVCRICGENVEEAIPMIPITPTGVKMSLDSISMNYKQSARLYANVLPEEAAFSADIVWESSNPNVVSVDENGTITALRPGTAEITASTADGQFSASCTVTVQYSWIQKIIIYVLFGWLWY